MLHELAMKPLLNGRLMKGVRLELTAPAQLSGAALTAAAQALADHIGQVSLELLATTALVGNQVALRVYLIARFSLPVDDRKALPWLVSEGTRCLSTALNAHGVPWALPRAADEPCLPCPGCVMLTKRRQSPGEVTPLPLLHSSFTLPLSGIAQLLRSHPGSGISLQLLPGPWTAGEIAAIRRISLDADLAETLVARPVCAFTLTLWGGASASLADLLVQVSRETLAVYHPREDALLVPIAAHDPWALYERVRGLLPDRRHLHTLLMQQELLALFPRHSEPAVRNETSVDYQALLQRIEALQQTVTSLLGTTENEAAWQQHMTTLFEQLSGYNVSAQMPLTAAELRYMGLQSEAELQAAGLSDELLEKLRIAAGIVRRTGLLTNTFKAPADGNYMLYMLAFGHLYEQMVHEYYYPVLYRSFLADQKQKIIPAARIKLSEYDQGPKCANRDAMIQHYASKTCFRENGGETVWTANYWQRVLRRMEFARKYRNEGHDSSLSAVKAREFLDLLLCPINGELSLMQQLLKCGRAVLR